MPTPKKLYKSKPLSVQDKFQKYILNPIGVSKRDVSHIADDLRMFGIIPEKNTDPNTVVGIVPSSLMAADGRVLSKPIVKVENTIKNAVIKHLDDIAYRKAGAPFSYDELGNFIPNPNYYYRRGWGIVDDAIKTGIVRVPKGNYKPGVLKKYPFLDNGNPFSTMLRSQRFPYFSEGKLWWEKFGRTPEDLIAIPNNLKGVKWIGGSKWGTLRPDLSPKDVGGRATPLVDGHINIFPTNRARLYHLDEASGKYIKIK